MQMKDKQKEARELARRVELQDEMLADAQQQAAAATATVTELRRALDAAQAQAPCNAGGSDRSSAEDLAGVLRRTLSSSAASSAGAPKQQQRQSYSAEAAQHAGYQKTIKALEGTVAALQAQLVRPAQCCAHAYAMFKASWWFCCAALLTSQLNNVTV